MKLNMHIVRQDLADLGLEGFLKHDKLSLNLAYPVLCTEWPRQPERQALYLVPAALLPAEPPRYGRLSLICFGRPGDAWRTSSHSVLWTEADVDPIQVMNRVSQLFWRYSAWEDDLRAAVDSERPFEHIARATQPLFANPFAALSTAYRMIFTSFPEVENASDEYLRYVQGTTYSTPFMSEEDIVSVITAEGYGAIAEATEPIFFTSPAFAYRTLIYNIRVGGQHCAYLCMDEALEPITDRDQALFKHFGDILEKALADADTYALTHSEVIREVLHGLLDHRLLPVERIRQLLSAFSWHERDTFVAAAISLRDEIDQRNALDALALSIARGTGSDCYAAHDGVLCFVFNLTALGISRDELIDKLGPLMDHLAMDASISGTFDDFKNLYYYFRQAMSAGWIGWHKDSSKSVYPYEDDSVDYLCHRLVDRCEKTIPEVLVPDGLKRLIDHDRRHDRDYAHLLDVFLRNERNIAKTIREEYLPRNTFNYRLRRIAEISGLDLDDEDVRFQLLIAFRLLERDGER